MHPRALPAGLAVACVLGIAAPAAAPAATFCVHQPGSACSTGSADTGADLQGALDAAKALAGPDRVEIGPGTFDAPSNSGFDYTPGSGSNSVDVVGAGPGQTTLASPGELLGSSVIRFPTASPSTTISQLSVRLNTYQSGISMSGGVVHDVDVAFATGATPNYDNGVILNGATVRDSEVTFPPGATTSAAVLALAGTNRVEDVVLHGGTWGVEAYTNTTIHRSRITSLTPVLGYQAPVTIDDSLLIATSEGTPGYTASGIEATDQPNDNTPEQASVNASNVTIVAGDANSTGNGVWSHADGSGDVAEIQIANSIVRGYATAFRRSQANGGTAVLSPIDNNSTGTDEGVTESGHNGDDPHFVDAAAGDYRLLWDSPLIDAGTLHGSAANSDTDLDGQPRYVTVHGDSSRDVDFGAFEYQHRAPVAVAAASPAAAGPGQELAFSGAGSSDPDAGDSLAYAWSFDDGAAASGQDAAHAFATPGDHTATLTVTDPTGLSAARTVTVTVATPPTGGPGAPGSPGGQGDVQATPDLELSGKPSVHGTTVRFTVTCTAGPCTVDSTAVATELMRSGHVVGVAKRRRVTVARRSVTLAAGEQRKVKLALTRRGRGLLRKYRRLPVRLRVTLRQPDAASVTVAKPKLTFRKRRHRPTA